MADFKVIPPSGNGPKFTIVGGKSNDVAPVSPGIADPGSVNGAQSPLTPALKAGHPPDPTHMEWRSDRVNGSRQVEVPAAHPGPGTESFFQPGINILTGMLNQIEGGTQRASPNIAKYGKPIGEVGYDDAGLPVVTASKGVARDIDPKTEVILTDPDTGKQMVYKRNANTKENAMASLGNIILPGLQTTSPAKFARTVTPRSKDVAKLMDEGINPTIGQRLGGAAATAEEKLKSVPLLGDTIAKGQTGAFNDMNAALYNRVLAPIGQKIKLTPGRDAIQQVEEAVDKAYTAVKGKITFKPDPQLVSDLNKVKNDYTNGAVNIVRLTPENAAEYNSIMKAFLGERWKQAGPKFQLSGEEYKHLESNLSKWSREFKGSTDPAKRQLGRALEDSLGAIRTSLARTNPQHAKDLTAANEAWRNYVVLRNAAGRVGAKNGVLSPSQFQAAVRAMDQSVGKGRYAEGRANLQDLSEPAENVLGPKVPDSGTAGRSLMANPYATGAGAVASLIGMPFYSDLARALLAKIPVNLSPTAQMSGVPAQVANLLHGLAQQLPQQPKKRWGQP